MTRLLSALRRRFVAGLIVTVPLMATLAALAFLLRVVDGILGPWVAMALGHEVPGLGLLATLALVLVTGSIATNFLGRRRDGQLERLANVFIPGPPVPTTGVLIVVPAEELVFLDMSVEDALKLVLSGGLVTPPELRSRPEHTAEPRIA